MSIIQMLIAQMFSGEDVGDIGHSLRFRSSASPYLGKSFAVSGNRQTWTWSGWVKRGDLANNTCLFAQYTNATNFGYLRFSDTGNIRCYIAEAGVAIVQLDTTALYRDPSSHAHITLGVDTTQATASNRVKLYVNGVQVTSFSTATYPVLNANLDFNRNIAHFIGQLGSASQYLDGYLSRVCFVGGTALTPSSFGYLNTNSNEWVSNSQSAVKAVVDAGGTNSFMLDFDDGTSLTTLGYDKSSKGNNWTLNNISLTAGITYDWMLDVPGNSYATLNPLAKDAGIGNITYSYGNLTATSTSNQAGRATSTIEFSEGKFYFEWSPSNALGAPSTYCGVWNGLSGGGRYYTIDGTYWNGSGYSAYGNSYASGDIIGCAIDMSGQTIEFFKNGASQGQKTAIGLVGSVKAQFDFYISGGSAFCYANFGQRPFAYTPPTDFLALNQANLSASGTVIISGSFTGNASTDGPFIWMNGVPDTLTINGNAVTFGTHADKLANGFKLRTSSASYNVAGSNTWTATITSDTKNIFKYNTAEGNP